MESDGKVIISTELDNRAIPKGIKAVKGALGGLNSVVKSLGIAIASAFAINKIVSFAAESSQAARNLTDALTGLRSILEGQGRSFSNAQAFIEEYTKDGLIPATNAINAYKNLASRGYDDSQVRQVMLALKDASAYGRQASYTMGAAVEGATEGLKNENSVLVDNAGVTKNVAKMWEEYAASIGTTANNLTQEQKIQAEVAGILEETKYQTGDAAKVAGTLSGQLQQLSFNFNNLKVAVGNVINPIAQSFLPIINTAVQTLTRFANSVATVVGLIFGKASVQASTLADSNDAVASSASAGAAAEKELAGATKAAGKAAQKSLAGFDELNRLQADAGSGGVSAGTSNSGGTSTTTTVEAELDDTVSPKLQTIADKIQEFLAPLREIDFAPAIEAFGRLGEAAGKLGKTIGDGLEWAWTNILVPLAEWTIEKAVPAVVNELADALEATNDALKNTSKWIEKNQKEIKNILILVGSVGVAFGAVSAIAGIIEYVGAVAALAPEVGLLAAMFPKISSAIATAAGWITGTMVPAISAALAGIAGTLGISVGWLVAIVAAVGAAIAAIIIYWDEIVAAAKTAWASIQAAWGVVVTFFTALWSAVSALASGAWGSIKEFFSPAIEWFSELLNSVGQTFSDIFHNIGVIASGCWEVVKAVWAVVSKWFYDTVISPVATFFSSLWSGFTTAASQAWEAAKEIFGKVAGFFKQVFSDAWAGVVGVFSVAGEIFTNIKDGILTAFKTVVNALITGINNVISIPFNGINAALESIRDIEIVGLTPFSGLSLISVPQIPYLAQGAVLPANKPFLAMVGDQKHGTNIEAPLATIQEAVAIVMEDMTGGMMAGFEATVAVLKEILEAIYGIEIGDEVIAKAAQRYQAKMAIVRRGG